MKLRKGKGILSILLILLAGIISCEKYHYSEQSNLADKFVPTDVLVKTRSYYTIDKVFSFINSFDNEVESITCGVYTSSLPSDSLEFVLDYLNAKSYTNDGIRFFVTGYLNYQTQIITIFPNLYHIKNIDYQADWLQSIKKLKLTEVTDNTSRGYIIFFHVPEGKEKEWESKFKQYSFVEWADLNHISDINPFP